MDSLPYGASSLSEAGKGGHIAFGRYGCRRCVVKMYRLTGNWEREGIGGDMRAAALRILSIFSMKEGINDEDGLNARPREDVLLFHAHNYT